MPGFLNADRWIGIDNPKISVATYDLENVEVLRSPAYLAVGGDNGSPWTKRTANFRKGILRYEGEQLFPGERTAPPQAAALMMIGMNIAPEHEHEFNEWYNSEHVPALGSVPGVLCARRYRGTGGAQRYVALYHLEAPEIYARRSGAGPPTPPGRKSCAPISATICGSSAAATSAQRANAARQRRSRYAAGRDAGRVPVSRPDAPVTKLRRAENPS